MTDYLDKNKIAAKRLGRLVVEIYSPDMTLKVIWKKVIFANQENLSASESDTHSFYEIYYVMRTQVDFMLSENTVLSLKDGQFIIIPPGQKHKTVFRSKDAIIFALGFYIESNNIFINNTISMLSAVSNSIYQGNDFTASFINMMLNNAYSMKSLTRSMIANLLECFVIEIFRIVNPEYYNNNYTQVFDKDAHIEKIKNYINLNANQPITVSDISAKLNMSERQLNRIVKAHLGCTIGNLIDRKKADYIIELLISTSMPISEVSKSAGFNNPSSMIRFFKRMEGCTPRTFKQHAVEK